MTNLAFLNWKKRLPKEEKYTIHQIRIFEDIFMRELMQQAIPLKQLELISIYCLADERKPYSLSINKSRDEAEVMAPYDFGTFAALPTAEEKYREFRELVFLYVVPVLEAYTDISSELLMEKVENALKQIEKQEYQDVFLAGKTPKKSPSRKQTALLKGIHRPEGFQLYCEVYNAEGLRIVNQLLVEEVGNSTVYARFLGDLKWESESRITVKFRASSWQAVVEMASPLQEKNRLSKKRESERAPDPESSGKEMLDPLFWRLIKLLDMDAEEPTERLVAYLAGRPEETIFSFEEALSYKLHLLDRPEHAGKGKGYFSPDAFLYARCAVVARGKSYFEKVRRKGLAIDLEEDAEELLEVAGEAYEEKTGKAFEYTAAFDYETYENREAWEQEA